MMFTRSLVRGVVFPMKFIIVMFFCLESLVGLDEFWKAFIFSSSFVQRNSKDRENDNLFFF